MTDSLPRVVIVSGAPASGKTAVARKIAGRYKFPLFSKDVIKESLFDSIGWKDREWSKKLGRATYSILIEIIRAELTAGRSFVVESNFRSDEMSPVLMEIKNKHAFRPIQVLCQSDRDIRLRRFVERNESGRRHPGHVDHFVVEEMANSPISLDEESLEIGGELVILDTNDFESIDYEALYSRLDALIL